MVLWRKYRKLSYNLRNCSHGRKYKEWKKKLSLSSGGKLTLKNSISANKSPNSITANSRSGRGTVQVEVKRTKRLSNRLNINENTSQENKSGLSAKEIQDRSRKLQEGLAKTAAEAEIIASEKIEKAKLEEARIAANALEDFRSGIIFRA